MLSCVLKALIIVCLVRLVFCKTSLDYLNPVGHSTTTWVAQVTFMV